MGTWDPVDVVGTGACKSTALAAYLHDAVQCLHVIVRASRPPARNHYQLPARSLSGGSGRRPVDGAPPPTSTCNPSALPTDVVVVAVAGTSSAQFGQLVTQLKLEQGVAVSDQTNLEDVDFRFLVADIDTCQALGLAQNSLVETIVLNAAVQLDSGAPFDGSKAVNQTEGRSDRRSELLSDGRVMSGSSRQEKRQIPTEFHGFHGSPGTDKQRKIPGRLALPLGLADSSRRQSWLAGGNLYVHPSAPRRLARVVLTANFGYSSRLRKVCLPGTPADRRPEKAEGLYLGYRGPEIALRELRTASSVHMVASVLTSFRSQDLQDILVNGYDLTLPKPARFSTAQDPPDDRQGHGTQMAGGVGGRYSGVYKAAQVGHDQPFHCRRG